MQADVTAGQAHSVETNKSLTGGGDRGHLRFDSLFPPLKGSATGEIFENYLLFFK